MCFYLRLQAVRDNGICRAANRTLSCWYLGYCLIQLFYLYCSLQRVPVSLRDAQTFSIISRRIRLLTISIFYCSPLRSYWNLKQYRRDCFNEAPLLLANTCITPILDFFVWVIPLPSLYHLKLPLLQRIALIALFSFGLVVISAGCIRIYYIHYVLLKTYDVTWYGFQLWLWTPVEVQLGIICGCVPWIKPVFKSRARQTVTSTSGGRHSDGQREIGFKEVTIVRMGSLRKAWISEGPSTGDYIDLERSGGDLHTQPRFSNTSQR